MRVVARRVLATLDAGDERVGVVDLEDTVVQEPEVDEDGESELDTVGRLRCLGAESARLLTAREDEDADEKDGLVEDLSPACTTRVDERQQVLDKYDCGMRRGSPCMRKDPTTFRPRWRRSSRVASMPKALVSMARVPVIGYWKGSQALRQLPIRVTSSTTRRGAHLSADTDSVDEEAPRVNDDPDIEVVRPGAGEEDRTDQHDEGVLAETELATDPISLDTDDRLTDDDTASLSVVDGVDPVCGGQVSNV